MVEPVYFGDTRLPGAFWSKVSCEPNSGCWLWTGAVAPGGYGSTWVDGERWRAPRLAYFQLKGPFDLALNVCHSCDNPYCVNPAHLWLGTQRDNMRDMFAKRRRIRRHRKEVCKRGHPRTPDNVIAGECRECRRTRQRVNQTKEQQ